MTRLREPFLAQKTSGSKVKERSASPAQPIKRDQFRVHAPRTPGDPDEFSRFVEQLNGQFGRVAEEFAKRPETDTSHFVTREDLPDLLDEIAAENEELTTTAGESTVNTTKATKSSRGTGHADEAAAAAIQNALPTAPPPNVASASSIGTTFDPAHFSLQDHTHGGVLGAPPAGGVAGQVAYFTSAFEIGGDNAHFWDNTNKRLGIGTTGPSFDLDILRSASGATVEAAVRNSSNTAASFARVRVQVAGTTADDPYAIFEIAGGQVWAVGLDNSDSDKFKIARSSALGTNDSVVVDTSDGVSLTGKVVLYENIATQGKGVAPITAVVSATAQAADIADTALANTGTAGLYRVSVYIQVTTTAGGAGTVTANIKFTDETTAQTLSTAAVNLAVAGSFAQSTFFIRRNSAGITYGTTHTGIFSTSQYAIFVTAERLS